MRSSREERSTRLRACKSTAKRLRVQDIRNDARRRYATIDAPSGAAVAEREAARVELRAFDYQTHGRQCNGPIRRPAHVSVRHIVDCGEGCDGMDDIDEVQKERRVLLAIAYRMLGTVADAEDAVQETYVRWYRQSDADRERIENPKAWLTRVVSRICLDMLGSARARRERYVGEWLPEPLPGESAIATAVPIDPLDRVTLDESVSVALMVVLESLTPAERVAFVLHDVFAIPFAEIAETVGRTPEATRQLASHARRRVHERRAGAASREQHDAVARAFAEATMTGELSALITLLDPDVVLRADGGGKVSAARRPVVGPDRVARFLLGIPHLEPTATIEPTLTPEGMAYLVIIDGRTDSVISVDVTGDRITDIYVVRNPDKLTLWR
jgi:RNA polymerase sigma-70 factor (ECF subfamily)